ncbi:MAG: polyprenyl synthetase family protein [Acidobacteria bacterium]|nr:polyprenyl synthetase family protein [Acidobacteriota bacterium]
MGLGKLRQSLTAREIFGLVQEDLKRVEEQITLESVGSVDAVTAIARHLHESGGKRIRPILLLLACRLFREPGTAAIRLAAVVEMIHAATLVHDDVIDGATTRRGRPSTNALWGNQTSVLAGDWLYMQAFQMALGERNFHILDVLIALTQMMVEGELVQLERLRRVDVSEADYMELVDRKTASLFSACARLGAVTGGAGDEAEQRLADFAWNLGMAFQLVDDILDFTSRETVLGKPVGNDLREGKVTLPLIYALDGASPEDRRMVECVISAGNYSRVTLAQILDLIERHRGFDRARDRANQFADKARKLITSFPESPSQKALLSVTELVTEREY